MDFSSLHAFIFSADRLLPGVMAACVALAVGFVPFLRRYTLPFLWHILGGMLSGLADRLDRADRGVQILRRRGFAVTVFWGVLGAGIGWILQSFLQHLGQIAGVAQIVFLAFLLVPGGAWAQMIGLCKGFQSGTLQTGVIYALSRMSGLALGTQDDATILRLSLMFFVRLLDKALMLPLLWFVIAGLPAACAVSLIAACAWQGGRDAKTSFGEGVYTVEKLAGFVPTWITGFLVSMAAFIAPKASIARAMLARMLSGEKAPYEEGGAAVTNLAYTLGVALGGPIQDIKGVTRTLKWIGPTTGSAQLRPETAVLGVYLLAIVAALWGATLLGAAVWG